MTRAQLEHIIRAAGAIAEDDDILIVGGRPESAPMIRTVADREPGHGPLGGLHTALLESTGDRIILLACDMPYVAAPLLRHLCTLADEADVVVPRTDRGYHPLCAVYTRACLDPVVRRLAAGHLKMTDLFHDLRIREVPAEELRAFGDVHRLLANVNSRADQRELEAVRAAGATVRYLPAYSPDLNPIEMAFSKLKAALRKGAKRTVTELWKLIGRLVKSFAPDECANYFRHAGYRA